MTEEEAFDKIDIAIESFIRNKDSNIAGGIDLSKEPHSDWLIFNWRQLVWTTDNFKHIIEIYPSFNSQEEIKGWNLYAAASYDQDHKRYYINRKFVQDLTIDFIADNLESLLEKSFEYLSKIKKEEIPFAVDMKRK